MQGCKKGIKCDFRHDGPPGGAAGMAPHTSKEFSSGPRR